MEKIYDVTGTGNYSWTYNCDTGVPNLSACVYEPDEYTPAFQETCRFMGHEVDEYQRQEHGGSRIVRMLVKAVGDKEALKKARLYCEYYYPER